MSGKWVNILFYLEKCVQANCGLGSGEGADHQKTARYLSSFCPGTPRNDYQLVFLFQTLCSPANKIIYDGKCTIINTSLIRFHAVTLLCSPMTRVVLVTGCTTGGIGYAL